MSAIPPAPFMRAWRSSAGRLGRRVLVSFVSLLFAAFAVPALCLAGGETRAESARTQTAGASGRGTFVSAGGAGGAASPGVPSPWPAVQVATFPSLATAVEASVPAETVVVAFGELHQRTATAHLRSTLKVFTDEVLPSLAPRLSHLVLETWVTTGQCGADETAAVAEVERKTERPKHVENELLTLVTAARARGVSPQVLTVDCAAYKAMRGADGVDFAKTLQITTDALAKKIQAVLDARSRAPADEHLRPTIAVYGGALHNDLVPSPDLATYSFGPAVYGRVKGAYVEIDVFLPPLIEASRRLLAAESWYRAYVAFVAHRPKGSPATVLRLGRAPGSYVMIPLGPHKP